MYNEMEYQEEYRMADLIRRQWLGIITAEEQAELEAWLTRGACPSLCKNQEPGRVAKEKFICGRIGCRRSVA
mgnify:CR=1 FL=1